MSFVRRDADRIREDRQMFGGEGLAHMAKILNGAEELGGKGRVFNHVSLAPGSQIGWHVHHGDGEVYYVLRGHGDYSDNGVQVAIGPGDVTWVGDGEGHGVTAVGDEPLEMIALVLYS